MKVDTSNLFAITGKNPGPEPPAPEIPSNAVTRLEAEAKRRKEQAQQERERHEAYQNSAKKAGNIRIQLVKGTQAGENLAALFLQAVEVISLMTGDQGFATSIRNNLDAVYGIGLQDPDVQSMRLQEITGRLERLKEAVKREDIKKDNQEKIKNAIRQHEEQADEIRAALEAP